MTRIRVFQLGLLVLLFGGSGYLGFRIFGLDGFSAGIASEALLVLIICIWTGTYFGRVITGNMTFNEQRKRYRKLYDKKFDEKIQKKFNSMSEEEQIKLIKELEE